jgi:hypothetical protein
MKISQRSSSSSSSKPSSSHSLRSQVIRLQSLRYPSRISTSSTRHRTRLAKTSPFPVVLRVPSQRNVNIKGSSRKRGPMISQKPLHRTYRDPRTRQMLEVDLKMLDKSKIATGCYLISTTRIMYRISQLTIQVSILKESHQLKKPSLLRP